MTRGMPYAWLLAESAAWPLASALAFERRLIALAPDHRTARAEQPPDLAKDVANTRALADDLDAWLAPRAGGWSLEALRGVREQVWFDHAHTQPRIPLADHICALARAHLQHGGPAPRLARHTQHAWQDQLVRWRWLSLAVPADLLVAAISCCHVCRPASDHVALGDPTLDRVLEQPVAETHLHVSASAPFSAIWTGLMTDAHKLDPNASYREAGEPPPFGSGPHLVAMLRAAAIARRVIAAFLAGCAAASRNGQALPAYVHSTYGPTGPQSSPVITDPIGRYRRLRGALVLLERGFTGQADRRDTRARLAGLADVYRALTTRPQLGHDRDPRDRDPIRRWYPRRPGNALPETLLAADALTYLRGRGVGDTAFARLFWQYQRVRVRLFRYLVHTPGISGLDWFRIHFVRAKPARQPLRSVQYRVALENEHRGLNLAALELRGSPERSARANYRELRAVRDQTRAFVAANPNGPESWPEVGLVLHWAKQRTCSSSGLLTEDPHQVTTNTRFGRWFRTARLTADVLSRMLDQRPGCLRWLRGLDVANTELAVATWVTVPIIQRVRGASARASHRLALAGEHDVPPLRTTYHAGEEYRRMSEGLRRIHELIASGVLTRGDRIGHGLVLGVDPSAHARERRRVAQPRQERLDDLLWEWERYACGDLAPPAGRDAYVRDQATRLAREIFSSMSFDDLLQLRRDLHDPARLARLDYPMCRHAPSDRCDPALRNLHFYLTDRPAFLRGQRVIDVDATDAETDAMAALQRWLRGRLAHLSITIESNPSSNWLIADMGDIDQHPSLRLQPLAPAGPASDDMASLGPRLPLSINTDNPLTFATRLADEYAYLHAALVSAGVSGEDALAWLDRARDAGWRSRFTLPRHVTARGM